MQNNTLQLIVQYSQHTHIYVRSYIRICILDIIVTDIKEK